MSKPLSASATLRVGSAWIQPVLRGLGACTVEFKCVCASWVHTDGFSRAISDTVNRGLVIG